MIHGWPGSFFEFSEVIGPLSDPDASPSFHVVVPSLPGFVFSSPPPRTGWTVKDTARIFHNLMLSLGYSTYAVQAGDWGAMVARELGAQYSDSCKVMHLNWCPGVVPESERGEETAREKKCREQGERWRTKHVGYAVLMRTRPRTVGWLAGTPEGLLGFVGEKVRLDNT
jgi:pimeloyl-ACP methyl ester carboxylesterase